MFTKLDDVVVAMLCCPLCKGAVEMDGQKFVCRDCESEYPKIRLVREGHEEYIYDFRTRRPHYCVPPGMAKWAAVQKEYEKFHDTYSRLDDLNVYLDEVDSVKEIYTEEFDVNGSVLDVGGHQGRLRHYLADKDVPLYVCVDPFLEVFEGLESQANLLKAYPCLSKPCNFLACDAENLPFVANAFDWVHMRSVLDHFQDPFVALKEAYRVLNPSGTLLVGLTVSGGRSSLRDDAAPCLESCSKVSIISKISRKLQRRGLQDVKTRTPDAHHQSEDHMFHWRYDDLIDLLRVTKFTIVKEHWQKPPFTMCIYISARKEKNKSSITGVEA